MPTPGAPGVQGLIAFYPVAPPSDKEMEIVTQHITHRIERLMKRLGFAVPGNSAEVDAFQDTEPLLVELTLSVYRIQWYPTSELLALVKGF
jgi:hypothetical protein